MVLWTAAFSPSPPAGVAAAIAAAERALGVRFPPAFLGVATTYPQAEPDPAGVLLPGGSSTAVAHLLHFEDTSSGANIVNRIFPVEGVLEARVIPFAEDVGGDLFCFDYRETPATPPVAYWSVDTGLVPLAPDFDAFVAGLMSSDAIYDALTGG